MRAVVWALVDVDEREAVGYEEELEWETTIENGLKRALITEEGIKRIENTGAVEVDRKAFVLTIATCDKDAIRMLSSSLKHNMSVSAN